MFETKQTPENVSAHQSKYAATSWWRTVMVREILVKVTDKSFLISTLITVLLIIAGFGVSAFMGNKASDEASKFSIAVSGASEQNLAESAVKLVGNNFKINVEKVSSDDEGKKLVLDEKVDGYLVKTSNGFQMLQKGTHSGTRSAAVISLMNQINTASVLSELAQKTGQDVHQLTASMQVTPVDISTKEVKDSKAGLVMGISIVFGVLFMFSAMMFGMQIAQSVVEEKQSRVVEILVSAVPIRQILVGKVAGNTIMASLQIAIFLIIGVVGITFTKFKDMFAAAVPSFGVFLLFFIVGFIALACIWAATGAICTRFEDLQHSTGPLTMLLMVCYFLSFIATGTLRVVCSYIPIVSVTLMPARFASGEAQIWELLVSLAINIAFAVVLVNVGAKIYRKAILQTQGRLKLTQALRLKD